MVKYERKTIKDALEARKTLKALGIPVKAVSVDRNILLEVEIDRDLTSRELKKIKKELNADLKKKSEKKS